MPRSGISSGTAIGFLFDKLVENEDKIVCVPLDPPITLNISLVWQKNRQLLSGMKRFKSFIEENSLFNKKNRFGINRSDFSCDVKSENRIPRLLVRLNELVDHSDDLVGRELRACMRIHHSRLDEGLHAARMRRLDGEHLAIDI